MAIDVICRVVPGGFRCANIAEGEKFENLIGKQVQVRISQPRNLQFHKKYFAMLHKTLEMADVEINLDQWRHLVLIGSGHCDFVEYKGTMIAVPKSLQFGRMDDAEFSKVYSDSLDFICSNYVDDDPDSLETILQFI